MFVCFYRTELHEIKLKTYNSEVCLFAQKIVPLQKVSLF